MKRFGTILLLLLIFQYTFGLFAVYVWNSMAIKQSMKAAIAAGSFQHSDIHTITLSLQQLTATEAAYWQQDEVSYNGEMYDVVSTRQVNGTLTLRCICDKDENLLINTYQQTVEKDHNPSPVKNSITLKIAFSPFIISNAFTGFLPVAEKEILSYLPCQAASTKVYSRGVLTPPPRQA